MAKIKDISEIPIKTPIISNAPNEEVVKINIGGFKEKIRKVPKHNWAISTYIFAVLSLILLISLYVNPSSGGFTGNVIKENEIKPLINDFINTQLIQGGGVEIESIKEESGIYAATISSNGETVPIYFTKDGNFITQGRALVPIKTDSANTNTNGNSNEIVEVSADDDAVLGDKNAPVTIIEFSDYQCPYCEKFYTETMPLLKAKYISTGKAKLIYRDFPLSFHENAQKAAEAAECAGEQGDNFYWKMHDELFQNQQALDITNLKKYAQQIGLDTNKFNTCLDSGKMASEIAKDLSDGTSYGVSGTPAFFINGKELSGAQPFEAFQQVIDAELSK